MSENNNTNDTAASDVSESAQNDANIEQEGLGVATEKVEAKPVPRRFKVKVNGAEQDVDEAELISKYALAEGANKKFQEAAAMRKQSEEFIRLLKSNPRAVLSDPSIGVDLRKFAEEYLLEQIEQDSLTPEQKQYKEMEKKLRTFEEEKKQKEIEQREMKVTRLKDQYASSYESTITKALGTSGLPRTPKTVQKMASLMYTALENGIDLDPADLASMVKEQYMQDVKELFGQADADTLQSILGNDVANKLRKLDISRIKSAKSGTVERSNQTVRSESNEPKKKMSMNEYKELLDKKYK